MKAILSLILLSICSIFCVINKWKFSSIDTIPGIEPTVANVILPYYYTISSCSCITILLMSSLMCIL
jgi:uncharacterized membrane protein YkgB